MRYYNDRKSTIILGKEVIRSNSYSRDFSTRDIEDNGELRSAIECGRIKKFEGEIPKKVETKAVDSRYILDDARIDRPVVNAKTKTVEYIISDSDSMDSIAMPDNTLMVAKDGSGRKPADTIEDAFDARAMKNASEVIEDQMNKENEDSSFDDEENLSDTEADAMDALDVDEAMAQDFSQIVKKGGKAGAIVVNAKDEIEKGMEEAINEMNKVTAEDDEGPTNVAGTGKLVDIMRQGFNGKKKMIAKESDKSVLLEVAKATNNANLRSLVKQRLAELG